MVSTGQSCVGQWRPSTAISRHTTTPQSVRGSRLDGQYGTGAILADLAGLVYVMRGKDYQILKRVDVQARLHLPPDQHLTHPESGICRALYDCPDLALGPTQNPCRVVIATHPAPTGKSRVGVTRSGVVSELFLTNLPQDAFTASDIVALYLHRGAFENALAEEDLEQDPDRWCSHTAGGQETWHIIRECGVEPSPGVGTSACSRCGAHHRGGLLLSRLRQKRPSRRIPPRATDRQKWPCPGNKTASQGETLLSSPMGRCAVPPTSHWWPTLGAEKPMGACAWCMRPASAVVVPVPCANSVNGMAALPPSLAR